MKLQLFSCILLLHIRIFASESIRELVFEEGTRSANNPTTKPNQVTKINRLSRSLRRRTKPANVSRSKSFETQTLPGSARIVGGIAAGAGNQPFMVALYKAGDPTSSLPVCGGTLITPNVILTAAHCIKTTQSAAIGRYGHFVKESDAEIYVDLEARVHPLFDPVTYDFDYALLKLDRAHPNPMMVSLWKTPEIPEELTILGWGLTSDGGVQSNMLLMAIVRRFNTSQCNENYSPETISENMFCAVENGVDACQGDSGGPILISGTNIQVGITSWGAGCANATYPGVYTRIDKGYGWIEETICTDLSPSDCWKNGNIPHVTSDGKVQVQTCEDQGEFIGLGKKRLPRNCAWVKQNEKWRCPWYGEDFCPQTCEVDRCKNLNQ